MTLLTLDQRTAQRLGRSLIVFMSVETVDAFEESVTVMTIFPIDHRTALHIAQLTEVTTRMIGDLVVPLFGLMTELLSR